MVYSCISLRSGVRPGISVSSPVPTCQLAFPEAQPDLRDKLGKEQDLGKDLEKRSKPEANPPEISDWAEHVEADQPSSIPSGPVPFASASVVTSYDYWSSALNSEQTLKMHLFSSDFINLKFKE